MRRRIHEGARWSALGLGGLLIQDRFHGLDLGGTWRVVVLTLLGAAVVFFVLTWEQLAARIGARIPLRLVRADGLSSGDDRPLSVRIDREPIWHNVNYKAHVVEVHVVMKNQTDAPMEVAALSWQYDTGGYFTHHDPEVAQAVGRYETAKPRLGRHSVIEPGETESGWHFAALTFTADEPKLPRLMVKVSGYPPFEAFR
jgi:hypothetical protein